MDLVMTDILPSFVRCYESLDPSTWRESPWPSERAEVALAVAKRRLEYGTARELARRAFVDLGCLPCEIPSGPGRAPLWPEGLVGSITHCDGCCAAAVASNRTAVTLGIDAEPATPLGPGLLKTICSSTERSMLRELDYRAPGIPWSKVAFSAKEAVYKAWFPVTGRWLGFEDVDLTVQANGKFQAAILVDAPPLLAVVRGRFSVSNGLVRSAAIVERTHSSWPRRPAPEY